MFMKEKYMFKFNEKEALKTVQNGLHLRPAIEKKVDALWEKGIDNICWLGIGGTWASSLQVYVHMKEKSSLDIFVENAAEYLATGNKRIGKKTLVIISSVTGTTSEMVAAVDKVHEVGATVLGFIDKEGSPLAEKVDICFSSPKNEQLKFFMVADRLMYHEGCFPEYDDFYAQMDEHFARILVETEKAYDQYAHEYVARHVNDKLHYFVGAGAVYGATYSYAMCYWEEMHWMRTKSIHAAEFFHGMLEIIDEDTPVTVFVGEDSQRGIALRVVRFLDKINKNHEVIDSANIKAEGISPQYRGYIAHHLIHAITNRIDAALEEKTGHSMDLRRYYRKVEY